MKKVILNHESYLMYDEISKFKKDFNSLKYNNIEFILFPMARQDKIGAWATERCLKILI